MRERVAKSIRRRWDAAVAVGLFIAAYGYALAAITGSAIWCLSLSPLAVLIGFAGSFVKRDESPSPATQEVVERAQMLADIDACDEDD